MALSDPATVEDIKNEAEATASDIDPSTWLQYIEDPGGSGALSGSYGAKVQALIDSLSKHTPPSDSTTAFAFQNASGQNLLEMDTTNGEVVVRQPGGTAGTDEGQLSHDGNHFLIHNASGGGTDAIKLVIGGTTRWTFAPGFIEGSGGGQELGRSNNRLTAMFIEGTIDNALASDTEGLILTANSTQTARLAEEKASDSGGTSRMLSAWDSEFVDSTAASFTTRGLLLANDSNAVREAIRWEGDGSAARLGFFGASAVAQQTANASLTDNTGGTTDDTLAALTDPGSLTDNSGGTVDGTVAAVSGSGDDSTINNNFADVLDRLNTLQANISTIHDNLAELAEENEQVRTVLTNLGLAA